MDCFGEIVRAGRQVDLVAMLRRGAKKNPQFSLQDMRLVWENCIFFNGKGTKYGKIGDRTSAFFEELWAASGLDTGSNRHRRSTAGVAAAKYEPQEESDHKRPLRKQPSARAAAVSSRSARHQDEVRIDYMHFRNYALQQSCLAAEVLASTRRR